MLHRPIFHALVLAFVSGCTAAQPSIDGGADDRPWRTMSPPYPEDAFPLPVRYRPRIFTAEEIATWSAELTTPPTGLRAWRVGDDIVDVSPAMPLPPEAAPARLFAFDAATESYPNLAPSQSFELEVVTRDATGAPFPSERLQEAARYFARPQYYVEVGATVADRAALEAAFLARFQASPTVPIQELMNAEARALVERPFAPGAERNCYTAAQTLLNPVLGRYAASVATTDTIFCAASFRPGCDTEPALARLGRWYELVGPRASATLAFGDVLGPNNAHVYGYLVAGFRLQKLSQGLENPYHIVPAPMFAPDDPLAHEVVFRRRDPALAAEASIPAALAAPNELTTAHAAAAIRLRLAALTAQDVEIINRVFGVALPDVGALAPTLACNVRYTNGGEETFRVDDDPVLREILGSAERSTCGCAWVPYPPVPARVVKLVKTDGTVVRSTNCPATGG